MGGQGSNGEDNRNMTSCSITVFNRIGFLWYSWLKLKAKAKILDSVTVTIIPPSPLHKQCLPDTQKSKTCFNHLTGGWFVVKSVVLSL